MSEGQFPTNNEKMKPLEMDSHFPWQHSS